MGKIAALDALKKFTAAVVAANTGTASGSWAAGNDSRITGSAQKSANLSDLANAGTARTNLGLGDSATKATGTTAGTVAAGDDSRITGALPASGLDAAAASVVGNAASATSVALSSTYAATTRTPTAATMPTSLTYATLGASPAVVDRIGTTFYGTIGNTLYSSTDGQTWTLVRQFAAMASIDAVYQLASGELILVQQGGIFRTTGWATPATATASLMLAPNDDTVFLPWGVAVYADLIVAVSYANNPYTNSRYLKVSTNGGTTWATKYDLNTQYPANVAGTHWHAVAWDAYHNVTTPRLWASHGDDVSDTLYSDNFGTTWTTYVPTSGLAEVSANLQPTTLTASPAGMILGSDFAPSGVWLIDRVSGALSQIHRLYSAGSLYGIAKRGQVGTDGTIYISFQSIVAGESPVIVSVSADGRSASKYYESPAVAGETGVWLNVVAVGSMVVASGSQGAVAKSLATTAAPSLPSPGEGAIAGGLAAANAAAAGAGATAGSRSVVVGRSAMALIDGVAAGFSASSTNEGTAIGYDATSGNSGVALGHTSTALTSGVAIGKGAAADAAAVAIGSASSSTGVGAVAIGQSASTGAEISATAIGAGSSVTGPSGTSVGKGATAASTGVAIGAMSAAAGSNVIIGAQVVSTNPGVTSVGGSVDITGTTGYATALGYDATVTDYGTAVGWAANAGYNGTALGRNSTAANAASVALGSSTSTTASNQVSIGTKHIEVAELAADPAAPATNAARLYTKDNGAGKTQLCVRFATGAVQVIATEP